MPTQAYPYQVKGLEQAYKDIDRLNKNTRGIKIAAWITAISTFVLAIVGVVTLVKTILMG